MDDASNGYLVVVRLACILSASANQRTGRHPGQGRTFPPRPNHSLAKAKTMNRLQEHWTLGLKAAAMEQGKSAVTDCDRLTPRMQAFKDHGYNGPGLTQPVPPGFHLSTLAGSCTRGDDCPTTTRHKHVSAVSRHIISLQCYSTTCCPTCHFGCLTQAGQRCGRMARGVLPPAATSMPNLTPGLDAVGPSQDSICALGLSHASPSTPY